MDYDGLSSVSSPSTCSKEQQDGYIIIGDQRIPIFNLKFTPPPRKLPMREEPPTLSATEQLIRDFAAAHDIDQDTVRRVLIDSDPETPPAETLAALAAQINRGLVLHSTAAKRIPRAKLREHNKTRKQITGPSKLRTAKERKQAAAKLKEHRKRVAK